VKFLAPAKINLHLRVAPVSSDGFHPLLSWMSTVGLFDTLTLNRCAEPQIRLICDDPSLACDGTNLAVRAAEAILNTVHKTVSDRRAVGEDGLAIELQKRIPTGGGLGGGSSDAARTILGLNRLWGLNLPVQELSAVAASLGSDIAFFCYGPSSVCSGRGQIVRPIAVPRPRWVVLILPAIAVPTGPVYRRFDELLSPDDCRLHSAAVKIEPDWSAWSSLPAESLLANLKNDLERPAFDLHPALARLRSELEQFLGRVVRMSGSGSSLFTLFDEAIAAEQAAATINKDAAGHALYRAISVMLAPRIEDDLAESATA